jgi:hypothetical protein
MSSGTDGISYTIGESLFAAPPYFPQGSIMDPSFLIQPASLTTPFEFPVDMPTTIETMNIGEAFCHGTSMESVTQVVGFLRVCVALKGMKGLLYPS